jgi:hypothetical protein
MYESDTTVFLRELFKQKPHLVDEQRKGRALWWDRPQDLDTQARDQASRVPQAPYVYQTKR